MSCVVVNLPLASGAGQAVQPVGIGFTACPVCQLSAAGICRRAGVQALELVRGFFRITLGVFVILFPGLGGLAFLLRKAGAGNFHAAADERFTIWADIGSGRLGAGSRSCTGCGKRSKTERGETENAFHAKILTVGRYA